MRALHEGPRRPDTRWRRGLVLEVLLRQAGLGGVLMRGRLPPVPKFPIGPVYEELTGDTLPRETGRLKILCPVHSENRPSAVIDLDANRWSCFGCGEHGDAIDLVRLIEGVEFAEAYKRAATISGDENGVVPSSPSRARGRGSQS